MTFRGKYPAADKAKCIRCWCCTEVCPQNAITKSKKPLLGKILLRHFK
jgi:formate hydrogenlyase subunit 6/NADH:ubiquinone oxidoreductase subunit I